LFEIRPAVSVLISPQFPAKLVATVPPGERQNKGELMTRILLVGLDPETVDFSDPALPPGMTPGRNCWTGSRASATFNEI
jgi:hypothetical protein